MFANVDRTNWISRLDTWTKENADLALFYVLEHASIRLFSCVTSMLSILQCFDIDSDPKQVCCFACRLYCTNDCSPSRHNYGFFANHGARCGASHRVWSPRKAARESRKRVQLGGKRGVRVQELTQWRRGWNSTGQNRWSYKLDPFCDLYVILCWLHWTRAESFSSMSWLCISSVARS